MCVLMPKSQRRITLSNLVLSPNLIVLHKDFPLLDEILHERILDQIHKWIKNLMW